MKNPLKLSGRETVIILKDIQLNEQTAHLFGEWESGMRDRMVLCVTKETNVKVCGNVLVLEGGAGQ